MVFEDLVEIKDVLREFQQNISAKAFAKRFEVINYMDSKMQDTIMTYVLSIIQAHSDFKKYGPII